MYCQAYPICPDSPFNICLRKNRWILGKNRGGSDGKREDFNLSDFKVQAELIKHIFESENLFHPGHIAWLWRPPSIPTLCQLHRLTSSSYNVKQFTGHSRIYILIMYLYLYTPHTVQNLGSTGKEYDQSNCMKPRFYIFPRIAALTGGRKIHWENWKLG